MIINLIEEYKIIPESQKQLKLQEILVQVTQLQVLDDILVNQVQTLMSSLNWQYVLLSLKITQEMMNLLKFPEKRIQDLTVEILAYLVGSQNHQQQLQHIYANITAELNQLLQEAPEEYQNTHLSKDQLILTLMELPAASTLHHSRITEPMFQCNYRYTNQQSVMVFGLLSAFQTLSKVFPYDQSIENVIYKSTNHANKYVRQSGVSTCISLNMRDNISTDDSSLKSVNNTFIQNCIKEALLDESIEVRKEALQFFQTDTENMKKTFSIVLFINCHMENLMDQSASICSRLYGKKDDPSPIIGLANYLKEFNLAEAFDVCLGGSVSRYYQIRACSMYTLQSLLNFMQHHDLPIDIIKVIKCTLNVAFYEQDPQAREAGLRALYSLTKYHPLQEYKMNIIECAMFHLSDVPEGCKINSAKIVAQAFFQDQALVGPLINKKQQMMRDRAMMLQDFCGEMNEQTETQIQQQGGKDRVIDRHIGHLNWSMALIVKELAQLVVQPPQEFIVQQLFQILIEINYFLMQRSLYRDGMQEYKYITYNVIAEAVGYLKPIKRLPMKLLVETEVLQTLSEDLKNNPRLNEVLERIGKTVGETLLQARMESYVQ